MDSGHERHTRPTATAVAAPTTSVPGPRSAPAVESASPDITPVATAPAVDPTVDTGPIPAVVAPAVDPALDTGPIPAVTGPATTTAPPATPTPVPHPCRCGHDRDAHEHFRRGTDCAACGCGRFRKPGLLTRLRGQ
jgi:hypothetical protein